MKRFAPGLSPCALALAGLALGLCAPVATAQDAGVGVDEHGVGSHVVDHRLEGKSDRFEEGDQVVFWTRVVGGSDGQRIRHVWLRDGEEVVSIGLTLGGSHWRTYSRKTMHPGSTGKWVVEARDETDRVLARSEFACVPRGEASAAPQGGS